MEGLSGEHRNVFIFQELAKLLALVYREKVNIQVHAARDIRETQSILIRLNR